MSVISDDLPEPLTPDTAVKVPSGIETSMFFRLFALAPLITSFLPLPALRFRGTAISRSPRRNAPVSELGLLITSSTVPAATISPPCSPAAGPMSTM